MQNKIIRFILKLDNRAHIGCKQWERVDMLRVSERISQNKLTHIHTIWHNSSPVYLEEHFYKICDTDLRKCTRSSLNNSLLKNKLLTHFFIQELKIGTLYLLM